MVHLVIRDSALIEPPPLISLCLFKTYSSVNSFKEIAVLVSRSTTTTLGYALYSAFTAVYYTVAEMYSLFIESIHGAVEL